MYCKLRGFCPVGFYDYPSGGSSPCSMEVCPHASVEYNVLFAVDATQGVSQKEFRESLRFVVATISRQVQSNANIAVVIFNGAEEPVVINFVDSAELDVDEITDIVKGAVDGYDVDAETCLTDILDQVFEIYEDAPAAFINYFFLLAGPQEEGCSDPCEAPEGGSEYDGEYATRIRETMENGVALTTLLLGMPEFASNDHIRCLVETDPEIISIASYDEEDFYKTESYLRPWLCIPDAGIVDAVAAVAKTVAYKGGVLYNFGLKNGMTVYWVLFAAFMMSALAYYYRNKFCNVEKKLNINQAKDTYGAMSDI
eukprot:TRINITY_DN12_c0_g1_i4.p1 TRINITY_DN12_c0_g1~~TRINITY_DN12_c0_g1_i4.p1  ORF type:complete len:312 (+),score=75.54 TRINITY_DN12_c0_g1_i4:93-1028(+)